MDIEKVCQLAEKHHRAFLADLAALAPPVRIPLLTPQARVDRLADKVRVAFAEKTRNGVKLNSDVRLQIALNVLTTNQRTIIFEAMYGLTSDDVKRNAKQFQLPVSKFFHVAYVDKTAKGKISAEDVAEILRVGPADEYVTALRLGLNQGDVYRTLKEHGRTR